MSFGFSIGYFITLSGLIKKTANRVRRAPATFRIFEEDLARATRIFDHLRPHFRDYDLTIQRLSRADRRPLDILMRGIRDDLLALQERLERYSNVGLGLGSGFADYRFSGTLQELRDRLVFNMHSLQLVMHGLTLHHQRVQGDTLQRLEETVRVIRQGQMEQQDINVRINRRNRIEIEEQDHQDRLSDYSAMYVPGSVAGTAAGGSVLRGPTVYEGTVTSARDAIIDEWDRRDTAAAAFISDTPITHAIVPKAPSSKYTQGQTDSQEAILDLEISALGSLPAVYFMDYPVVYTIVLASFLTSMVLAIVEIATGGTSGDCFIYSCQRPM